MTVIKMSMSLSYEQIEKIVVTLEKKLKLEYVPEGKFNNIEFPKPYVRSDYVLKGEIDQGPVVQTNVNFVFVAMIKKGRCQYGIIISYIYPSRLNPYKTLRYVTSTCKKEILLALKQYNFKQKKYRY